MQILRTDEWTAEQFNLRNVRCRMVLGMVIGFILGVLVGFVLCALLK